MATPLAFTDSTGFFYGEVRLPRAPTTPATLCRTRRERLYSFLLKGSDLQGYIFRRVVAQLCEESLRIGVAVPEAAKGHTRAVLKLDRVVFSSYHLFPHLSHLFIHSSPVKTLLYAIVAFMLPHLGQVVFGLGIADAIINPTTAPGIIPAPANPSNLTIVPNPDPLLSKPCSRLGVASRPTANIARPGTNVQAQINRCFFL